MKPFNPDLSQGDVPRSTRNSKGHWEARNRGPGGTDAEHSSDRTHALAEHRLIQDE
jgi:hypothetical protein